jgi:hypothetical protein
MAQRFSQPYAERRRRQLFIVAAALLAAAVVVILLAVLLPCDGEKTAIKVEDGGPPIEVADGAALDGLAIPDLMPDQKPRPRGTRRISDRELRALLRRHGGLINACYTLAARRAAGTTPSRVSVKVTLGDRGRVRAVTVAAAGARRLSGCLRRAIQGWRFSKTLRAQQVSFPIVRPR